MHGDGSDFSAHLTEGDAVEYETEWDEKKSKFMVSSCSGFKTGGSGGRGGGFGGWGGNGWDFKGGGGMMEMWVSASLIIMVFSKTCLKSKYTISKTIISAQSLIFVEFPDLDLIFLNYNKN